MKVVLVNPAWRLEGEMKNYPGPGATSQPIGIAYVASRLRTFHDVVIIDALSYGIKTPIPGGFLYGIDTEELGELTLRERPDVIGIALPFDMQRQIGYELIRWIKKSVSGTPVIVGGPNATIMPFEALLEGSADYAIIGEGEETALELITAIDKGLPIDTIRGIAYLKDGNPIRTLPRPLCENLDSIPFYSRDLLPTDRYYKLYGRKEAVVLTSRGCPYNCIFCVAKNIWNRKWNTRSTTNILEEISKMDSEGIEKIHILDDNFNLDMNRAKAILRGVLDNKFNCKIDVMQGVRLDRLDRELLTLLKACGSETIRCPVESGCQETNHAIGKNLNLAKVKETIRLMHELDLKPIPNFIIGFPFETMENIRESLNYAKSLFPYIYDVNIYIAAPKYGTDLYEMVKKMGAFVENKQISHWDACIKTEHFQPEDMLRTRKLFLKEFSRYSLLHHPFNHVKKGQIYAYVRFFIKSPKIFLSKVINRLRHHKMQSVA